MSAPVTLYREIDALGGAAMSSSAYDQAHHAGYSEALDLVLAILTKRGFSEAADAAQAPVEALAGLFGAVEEVAVFLEEENWPRTAFGLRASAASARTAIAKVAVS